MKVETASGEKNVRNWGYQLQGSDKAGNSAPINIKELAKTPHDLIVTDFSRDGKGKGAFTPAEIESLKARKGTNPVIISYISIGEASDYRDHWKKEWTTGGDPEAPASGDPTPKAPKWLGDWNENWPNSRKVRYWDPEWQKIIFNKQRTGWLDKIVAQGFDGCYLDIVDGYYHWGCEIDRALCGPTDPQTERQAAERMVDFIVALADHVRETNPVFLVIPQNGALILDALEDEDPKRKKAYLEAISAIACEDLFFRGDEPENNELDPDKETIKTLQRDFLKNGCPVMSVDYLNDPDKVEKFYEVATKAGFLPYAAPSRDLHIMGEPYDGSGSPIA